MMTEDTVKPTWLPGLNIIAVPFSEMISWSHVSGLVQRTQGHISPKIWDKVSFYVNFKLCYLKSWMTFLGLGEVKSYMT